MIYRAYEYLLFATLGAFASILWPPACRVLCLAVVAVPVCALVWLGASGSDTRATLREVERAPLGEDDA